MSTEEVLKEICKDYDFVLARRDGLLAKNNKKLKNRYVKDGAILSISEYEVPDTKNKVIVLAIKEIATVNRKDYASIKMAIIVKTFFGSYIVPSIDPCTNKLHGYVVFTHHFVSRLLERLGKDFMTFFKEDMLGQTGLFYTPLDYKRGENEYYASIGDAFAFIKMCDNGRKQVFTTVVSDKELFCNQFKDKEESRKQNEKGQDTLRIFRDKQAKKKFKTLKSSGQLVRVA